MRKVILLLLLVFLLSGCSNGSITYAEQSKNQAEDTASAGSASEADDIYNPVTDWAYGVNTTTLLKNIAPAENGYYMVLTHFLFYMDADTMEPVPVCARPNCLHYNEPEDSNFMACDAVMGHGMQSFLTYYEGKLYHIEQIEALNKTEKQWLQYALICTKADGTDRRILYRFDETAMVERAVMHRGCLYAVTQSFGQEAGSQTKLWAYSMTNTRVEPECLLTFDDYEGLGGLQSLTAYGNKLYFYHYISEEGKREFCSYDLSAKTLTAIKLPDAEYGVLNETFIGDKMYLRCKALIPDGDPGELTSWPERLYRCELDGSNMKLLLEGWGEYSSDQTYLYRVPSLNTMDRENHYLRVYDAAGSEVDSVDLYSLMRASDVKNAGIQIPADGKGFLWVRNGEQPQKVFLYWFDKTEIGSGHISMHPLAQYAYVTNSDMRGTDLVDFDTTKMQKIMKAASGTTMAAVTTTAIPTTAAATATGVTAAVTTAPVRTPAAHWDTGSITVEPLGVDLEDKTVEFLCSVPHESFDVRLGAWEKAAQYISETYMGDVTLTPLPYVEYLQTLRKRQAAGDAPDVLPVENISGNKLRDMVQKGQLLPLDAYIPGCMPRSFARVDERLYETVKFNGNIYGILSLSEALFPRQVLYYDKPMTDAAGIEVGDWTRMSDNWDMFYKMREWLDANRPDLHDTPVAAVDITWANEGLFEMIGGEESLFGLMLPGWEAATGAAPTKGLEQRQIPVEGDTANRVMAIYLLPEFHDYLMQTRQLKEDRILPADWTFWPTKEQKEGYLSACVFWSEAGVTDRDAAVSLQDRAFCMMKRVTGKALVVSADSKAPDAACKLIEVLNCDKYVGTLLRLGEEGVHWTLDADGRAKVQVDLGMWNHAALGDVTNCLIPASEAADFREQFEATMANAVYSENLGFQLDVSTIVKNPIVDADLSGWQRRSRETLRVFLGMGTGWRHGSGSWGTYKDDTELSALMDMAIVPEKWEANYKDFIDAVLLYYDDGQEKYVSPLLEYQHQLDTWRAGR